MQDTPFWGLCGALPGRGGAAILFIDVQFFREANCYKTLKLQVRQVGDGGGAEYGGMGGLLGNLGLGFAHPFGAVGNACRRLAEEGLEPGAAAV